MAPAVQKPRSWLLLLTAAPSHASFSSLKTAYEPALTQSLREVSIVSKNSGVIQEMDIALAFSGESSVRTDQQSSNYSALQNLLGQTYKLLCVVCTRLTIGIEYDNEVNTRVILFDNTADQGICMFTMQSLAACHRSWRHIFTTRCTRGQHLVESFLRCRGFSDANSLQGLDVKHVDAGEWVSDLGHDQHDKSTSTSHSANRHYSVAVGGTFDHLHFGHKLLLTMTALVLDFDQEATSMLTIGITGDSLLKEKQYAEYLQTWDQRQKSVRDFILSIVEPNPSRVPITRTQDIETNAWTARDELKSGLIINYTELFDPFGPTIRDEEISALVISEETRSGGRAVNDRRKEKGWAPLEIFEVDVLDAGEDEACGSTKADFQDKISSTEIRRKLYLRHACNSAPTE